MTPVLQAAGLVAFPVAAAVGGSLTSTFVDIGPKVRSAVQHFAAGVVVAAVAGEVLPDLRADGHLVVAVLSFAAGVVFLLGLDHWAERLVAGKESPTTQGGSAVAIVPIALVVTVGVDLLIDGLLVGLGVTLGTSEGLILTAALTLEILFLSLAVTAELRERGASRRLSAGLPSVLGLLTAVGAISGAALLGDASTAVLAGVLAFGAAALLYLVTEELLVEAHETEDIPVLAAMFFVGFIVIFALGG